MNAPLDARMGRLRELTIQADNTARRHASLSTVFARAFGSHVHGFSKDELVAFDIVTEMISEEATELAETIGALLTTLDGKTSNGGAA